VQLLTRELVKQLRANKDDQRAICKFFNPAGGGTWIISRLESDGDTMWCLADLGLGCCEQGTVSLEELATMELPLGLTIERDIHFEPRGRTLADFEAHYAEHGTLAGVS
jgi:hypothetical protein